jgi:hypothetical protein
MKTMTTIFALGALGCISASANMIGFQTPCDGILTLELVDGNSRLDGEAQEVFAPDTPYSFNKTAFDNFMKAHPHARVEGHFSSRQCGNHAIQETTYRPNLTVTTK